MADTTSKDKMTQYIGSTTDNIETKIQTRGQILIVRPQLDTAVGSFYFAMNKQRSLTSYVGRMLVAIGKSRGPAVYLGGGWHSYSDHLTESQETNEDSKAPTEENQASTSLDGGHSTQSGPGVSNPFDKESAPDADANATTQSSSVTPRLVTHPPRRIIETVEQLNFEYYGIDPDIAGIRRIRKDTARSINVFDRVPDALLGNTDFEPALAAVDGIDWSLKLPPSTREQVERLGNKH